MFEEPRYTQNSFSIAFSSQLDIRRRASVLEDHLKGKYLQPLVLPVPDELDPEVVRIIFGSQNGHSQIFISQVSISLQVNYSPDWQTDTQKLKAYLAERVTTLFELLKLMPDAEPFFCGLITQVQVKSTADDQAILRYLVDRLTPQTDIAELHDIQIRITHVRQSCFFDNMQVQNHRRWKKQSRADTDTPRLPNHEVTERGILLIGDFNDRYAFNEQTNYNTNPETAQEVIVAGLDAMTQFINQIF